jgi:hypothetical protein
LLFATTPIFAVIFSIGAWLRALRKGIGINRTAKLVGLSNVAAQRLKAELHFDPGRVSKQNLRRR